MAPTRRRLRWELEHQQACQVAQLRHLIEQGRRTSFGADHGFSSITCARSFQAQVPIRGYEELKPYIDRAMRDGEANVLWPGRVRMVAESSGTGGYKKQIPVTPAAQRAVQAAGKRYMAEMLAGTDRQAFLRGATIFFVGSTRRSGTAPGILVGDVNALNVRATPWHLDLFRAPAKRTILIENWEEKLLRAAEQTIHEDIVHLAGMPPWLMHFGLMVLDLTRRRTLRDVWPNLSVVSLGSVDPGPYYRGLNQLILGDAERGGGALRYIESYTASEGFFAMQLGHDPGMTVLPNVGIFYEFVPRKEAVAGDLRHAVTLDQVRVGEDYAPVITTVGGLWRYLIGDIVRFTSTRPGKLEVAGRVHQSLNIAGEELQIQNTDRVVQLVCASLGLALRNYMVAGLKLETGNENAFHLWLLEFESPAEIENRTLAAHLDEKLLASHYDYARVRRGGLKTGIGFGLAPPSVFILPDGCFYRWLERRFQGRITAQTKVPRLSNDPANIRAVLSLIDAGEMTRWLQELEPSRRIAVLGAVRGQRTHGASDLPS